MRTGKWRDAGIACVVVLAWHLMLGWVLLRQWRIEPSRTDDDAIRVVFIQARVVPSMIRVSTPVSRHRRAARQAPPVATTSPPAVKALPDESPPSPSMSAVFLDQACAEARRQVSIDFSARDPFANRPGQLPGPGAGHFRMRPTRSPKDLVAAVGGYLFAPRGYDADPCPRNRENIGNLMAAGDSAALRQEVEFERRHCRP